MPQPKSVKIADVVIDEVEGVTINIDTPLNARDHYNGSTGAAIVQILRRAVNTPTSEMFKVATNLDGRFKEVKGTIVLQNGKMEETYTIEMDKAFITGWEFHQPPEDANLYETITLSVGEMKLSGSGKSAKYTAKHWDRNA